MAYFHEKEFVISLFLWIKLNDSFFVRSTTDFFLFQSRVYLRSKTVPPVWKVGNIIYEEDSHLEEKVHVCLLNIS